ncbi:MAG: hypothetical protein ACJ70T_06660 [Nitrososphaera sp.]
MYSKNNMPPRLTELMAVFITLSGGQTQLQSQADPPLVGGCSRIAHHLLGIQ